MAKAQFPNTDISIEKIHDDCYFYNNVIAVAGTHIFEDFLFQIKGPFGVDPENKKFFAGGHILHEFINMLSRHSRKMVDSERTSHDEYEAPKWSPTDIDLFCLGEETPGHIRIGGTDIVRSRETTLEELLMAFDLPCCRVATDGRLNYWISLQCLNAIYTGKYYLPEYLKTKDSILEAMGPIANTPCYKYGSKQSKLDHVAKTHLDRVLKYSKRGYTPNYVGTKKVLPWIKNGFFYIEFDGVTIPDTLPEIIDLYKSRCEVKAKEEDAKKDSKKRIIDSLPEKFFDIRSKLSDESFEKMIDLMSKILEE